MACDASVLDPHCVEAVCPASPCDRADAADYKGRHGRVRLESLYIFFQVDMDSVVSFAQRSIDCLRKVKAYQGTLQPDMTVGV